MGPINGAGQDFTSELGHQISDLTEDPCKTSFLIQCISVALHRSFQLAFVEDIALPCPSIDLLAKYAGNEGCKITYTYNFFNIITWTELSEMTWTRVSGAYWPWRSCWGPHAWGAYAPKP
jgi:hypothetical protein